MFKNKKIWEQEKFYIWLTCLFLLGQWIVVVATTVNVPQGDEWESLRENAFPSGFTLKYLFAFHNEHRIVFTKLVNYVFLYLSDWNMRQQIIANYIVFCTMVFFFIWFQKKYIPTATKGLWILPFFFASPLLSDNHIVAIQSVFHFCLLFGILAVFYATREHLKKTDFWLSALLALCSAYSLAAGLFFGVICILVLTFRLITEPKKSSSDTMLKWLSILFFVIGMGVWFIGYKKNLGHPAYVWPYEIEFWYFFSNLISTGFGFKTTNVVVATLAIGIVCFALWMNLKKAILFKNHYISLAFFGSLAVLGALASVTLSRAGLSIGQSKTSRYSEISILLVPFVGWLLWELAAQSPKYKKGFNYFIWFIFLGFIGDYSYSSYFSAAQDRKESLACITEYYQGENPAALCPASYPGSMVEFLENAKKLKLSWLPIE